jgi:hypothetical protein
MFASMRGVCDFVTLYACGLMTKIGVVSAVPLRSKRLKRFGVPWWVAQGPVGRSDAVGAVLLMLVTGE